jgi:hypothetical protein
MSKWGKLYSNLWIRISADNFEKLKEIQKDYELNSVDDVFELLVNTRTINTLADEANNYAASRNDKFRSKAS